LSLEFVSDFDIRISNIKRTEDNMIKNILIYVGFATFCVFLAGCEWTAGGGSDAGNEGGMATWNDRENFVDFSGAYKASDGGVLVRAAGAGSSSTTNSTTSTNSVSGEVLATGDGTTTAFSGRLANPPPIRGTLTIVVGGYHAIDPGTASAGTVNLTVTPADGSSGTLNLDTGVWTLTLASPIASGTPLLGAYQYLSSSSVVNSNQGNHGNPIYTFIIYQQGNTITIVDDCNSTYNGYIGNVRTTGGYPIDVNGPNSQTAVPTTGPIVAQLYATGVSQGYKVTISGVLQGTLTAASTLANRTITATFVETAGYAADIAGAAQ
jgi:hypothetical protein